MKARDFLSDSEERPLSWRYLGTLVLFFSGFAWFATAVLLSRSVITVDSGMQFAIGVAGLTSLIVLILALRNNLPSTIKVRHSLDTQALAIALVLGVLARVTWAFVFQPEPMSDGALYVGLARRILAGGGMQTGDALAFWPPGYPLFLVPFMAVFTPEVAIPLSQTALFIVAATGVHRLAGQLGSGRAATVAVFLFALWPNLVALCATPEKEMLVTACLVWAVISLLSVKLRFVLVAGLLFGSAALVQPSMQLLIPAALVFLLARHRKHALHFFGVFILGSTLVIAPWTVRNYVVLGEFKLISTNGGDVLYRANNPLATGGYTERGEVDLSSLPELERDHVAKAMAFAWMQAYPVRFAELMVEKQLLFMGDDAYGIYATFRGEGTKRNTTAYAALKLIANAWWLTAWLLTAVLISRGGSLGPAAFLAWGWLYLFGLHSVFESSGRYHVPVLWILCICISVLSTRAGVRSKSTLASPISTLKAEPSPTVRPALVE